MKITIKRIAEMAGVSRGTVDRALHGRGGISSEIREQILAIAQENNYRPNAAAKQLYAQRLELRFGFILPSNSGVGFWGDVERGIDAASADMEEYGVTVLRRHYEKYSVEMQMKLIDELLEENIAGLAIVPINSPILRAKLNELDEAGIPVVLVNTALEGANRAISCIAADYEECGRTAAGLMSLMERGRKLRLAILTGSDSMLSHRLRIDSFLKEFDRLGQSYELAGIFHIYSPEDRSSRETARCRTEEALAQHPEITAIYTVAGSVSGVADAILNRGLANRITHLAFDIYPANVASLKNGSITAVIGQESVRQGYQPIRMLFEHTVNGTVPPKRVVIRSQIYIAQNADLKGETPLQSDVS